MGEFRGRVFVWSDYASLRYGDNFVKPDNWPADVEVALGRWRGWLPPDWGQGKKTVYGVGGAKDTDVFVDPDGKAYWHKIQAEKSAGCTLLDPAGEPPIWPSYLPKTWGISEKEINGKMQRIWIRPEGDHYWWYQAAVMKYLANPVANPITGEPIKLPDEFLQQWQAWQKNPESSEKAAPASSHSGKAAASEGRATKAEAAQPRAPLVATLDTDNVGSETDTEVDNLNCGAASDTEVEPFEIQPCRGASAHLIVPQDVLEFSLEYFGRKFADAGWKLEFRSEHRHAFLGSGSMPSIVLYRIKGKVLCRTDDKDKAKAIADMLVNWLVESAEPQTMDTDLPKNVRASEAAAPTAKRAKVTEVTEVVKPSLKSKLVSLVDAANNDPFEAAKAAGLPDGWRLAYILRADGNADWNITQDIGGRQIRSVPKLSEALGGDLPEIFQI